MRGRAWLWTFVGWTLFVWGTRIRNIWTDATLTTSGQVGRTLLVVTFVVPAVAIGIGLVRRTDARWPVWTVWALAAWTVVVWVERVIGIAFDHHEAAFVAVHTVLGVISSVLAVKAVLVVGRMRSTISAVMGQPVTVIEKPSTRHGMVRFEVNRSLTGMDHERYVAGQEIAGQRPPDELARRIFERGGVRSVHVSSNVIDVDLDDGHDAAGLKEIIEGLFTYYREGVTPTVPTA
jgi:hypothetical protein